MSNAIALPEGMGSLVSDTVNEENFIAVAGSASFLPRLHLGGSQNRPVQQGKVPIGAFYLVERKDIIALSPEIHVINYGMRLKALDMRDESKIKAYYDPATPAFQETKKVAETKVQGQTPGALCGCEFLLWIPDQKTFVTFFLANQTLLGEAKKVRALVSKAMTLKSEIRTSKKFTWHGMICMECSLPLEQPSMDVLKAQVVSFRDQQKPEITKVEDVGEAVTVDVDARG